MLGTIRKLDLLHTSSKGCHIFEIKSNSADEIVKVALSEAQFNALLIIR
jgi:hypothetical protein